MGLKYMHDMRLIPRPGLLPLLFLGVPVTFWVRSAPKSCSRNEGGPRMGR